MTPIPELTSRERSAALLGRPWTVAEAPVTPRASGIHPDRGVAINAAASAGAELVLASEALQRPARGASLQLLLPSSSGALAALRALGADGRAWVPATQVATDRRALIEIDHLVFFRRTDGSDVEQVRIAEPFAASKDVERHRLTESSLLMPQNTSSGSRTPRSTC